MYLNFDRGRQNYVCSKNIRGKRKRKRKFSYQIGVLIFFVHLGLTSFPTYAVCWLLWSTYVGVRHRSNRAVWEKLLAHAPTAAAKSLARCFSSKFSSFDAFPITHYGNWIILNLQGQGCSAGLSSPLTTFNWNFRAWFHWASGWINYM